MSGADDNASITFINSTFREKNASARSFIDPDYGAWLIDEIFNKKKLMAATKGFFKKRYFCPLCNTELNPQSQISREIEYELRYKNFNVFKVLISIPTVECLQCKKICGIDLNGKLSFNVNEAIIHAFETQNIKPQ